MNSLGELSDRQEIHDLVLRYCSAVDRADYLIVRGVYARDGVDHHTGFSGTADDYVAWLRERTAVFDGTMHIVGNHRVELFGDHAFAETYGTAVHWGRPSTDESLNFTSGFRYLDHMRREPDGWRIVERTAVREWTRSDAGRLREPEGEGPRGRRGPDDPSTACRDRVRRAATAHPLERMERP
ncbi:nuclear transport factor 2 family protein [Microbacterium sp. NPDC028030]|uniref:nuclear transport factor 2 family protein n=1 Tax=Microbacterium sp. NPDC028030 TaxID=3155124 RepID=UPI0033F00473